MLRYIKKKRNSTTGIANVAQSYVLSVINYLQRDCVFFFFVLRTLIPLKLLSNVVYRGISIIVAALIIIAICVARMLAMMRELQRMTGGENTGPLRDRAGQITK